MKKIFSLFLLLLILIFSNIPLLGEPEVPSDYVILIDETTGQVLYEKAADVQSATASLTKIMTAILIAENGNMQDTVAVTEDVLALNNQALDLKLGELITVEDLFYATLLGASNESSLMLANYLSGTEDAFAILMNEKAKELGCTNTNFLNSHGLTEEGHYSSARDLAIIARYAMTIPLIEEGVGRTSYKIFRDGNDTTITNTNSLLSSYDGLTGMKTGYATASGYCIITSATRGDQSFIAVALGAKSSEDRFSGATALLDYAFENYEQVDFDTAGREVGVAKVAGGRDVKVYTTEDVSIYLTDSTADEITYKITIDEDLTAPLEAGTVVGTIDYYDGDTLLTSKPLINKDASNRSLFLYYVVGFILLLIIFMIYRYLRKVKIKNNSKGQKIKFKKASPKPLNKPTSKVATSKKPRSVTLPKPPSKPSVNKKVTKKSTGTSKRSVDGGHFYDNFNGYHDK